jgi:hypothetical protein
MTANWYAAAVLQRAHLLLTATEWFQLAVGPVTLLISTICMASAVVRQSLHHVCALA